MNDLEEILNVEVVVPQLEYTTHEQYTMQQEREANRKLKAQIRKRKKLGFKKMMVGNITVIYRPWQHDC